MHMTVIGTGYLGATHAACMAELGHEVPGHLYVAVARVLAYVFDLKTRPVY